MSSYRQRAEFKAHMGDGCSLDDAVAWIADNMSVDELFTQKEVEDSARDTCDPDDIFTKEQLVNWVFTNCNVGDVFPLSELIDWAKENGFKKEDE